MTSRSARARHSPRLHSTTRKARLLCPRPARSVPPENRFRSLLGKARAAQKSGEVGTARDAYQKLLTLAGQADADRQELAEAKAFLSKNI